MLLYETKKSLGGILSNGFQKLLSKIHGERYVRFTSTVKPAKQADRLLLWLALVYGIFARSFSIIRSRVSFGLVPVHFYQKFILLRHVCNTKQDFMAMSLKKFKQTFNKVFNKLDCSQSVSLFQRTRWKKQAKHPLQRTSKLKKQARQEKTKCLRCTWPGHYVMHKQRCTFSDSFRQKKPTWRHGKRMALRTGNTTNRLKLSLSSSRSSSTY